MKVNNIDIKRYGAKQLTVDIQPPQIVNNYEWIDGALLPVMFDSDVQAGRLNLTLYFRGSNRNNIIRNASKLMAQFKQAVIMDLDGYKGHYMGMLASSDYEKMRVKGRYKINLEFDGYFYDDDIKYVVDGKESVKIFRQGSRETPCTIEITARANITDYTISGLGDDITIEYLAAGETILIDGENGLITINGVNAFDRVNLWEFPKLEAVESLVTFSSASARVVIKYKPMWI